LELEKEPPAWRRNVADRRSKAPERVRSYCTAAAIERPARGRWNKSNQINELSRYDAILTWLDVVSMVRAAFEGDGTSFPATAASFRVSTAWLKARTKTEMEVAINRPTKLRFPQGSEVWISGCPKFETTGKSGLTNPELKAETEVPEPRRWRAVSDFLRS
jgi:hypothetical protein